MGGAEETLIAANAFLHARLDTAPSGGRALQVVMLDCICRLPWRSSFPRSGSCCIFNIPRGFLDIETFDVTMPQAWCCVAVKLEYGGLGVATPRSHSPTALQSMLCMLSVDFLFFSFPFFSFVHAIGGPNIMQLGIRPLAW